LGDKVVIEAEGPDEVEAVQGLSSLIASLTE
jgi:phosphotransferase system HPr-like phosphotransfer protein